KVLWRGAMLVPVVLVLFPYPLEVDWKWWIPISQMFRAGDPRILRHQIFVRSQALDGYHGREAKAGGFGFKLSSFMPNVVVERNRIANPRAKLTSRPLVENNVIGFSCLSWRQQFET